MLADVVSNAIEREMAIRRVPGASAALVEEGSVVWTGAFGVRRSGGEAVTADTVFEAASIGKPVFAWYVLDLCSQGLLELDTPLTEYTPDRFVADDAVQRITARMILTHTSGLSWEVTGPGYEGRPCFDGVPGGDFQYSGVGFEYLAAVVQRLVGRPMQDLMRDFMASLGMTRSNYAWDPSFEGDYASPHDLDGNVGKKYKSPVLKSVGSELHTTAPGLGAFLCEVLRPTLSTAHALALRPQVEVHQEYLHGPPGPGAHWGLGIGVWTVDGETTVWHWGENPGFQSFFVGWPARRRGLLVLTNSDHGHWVSKAAVAAFAGQPHPAIAWIEN